MSVHAMAAVVVATVFGPTGAPGQLTYVRFDGSARADVVSVRTNADGGVTFTGRGIAAGSGCREVPDGVACSAPYGVDSVVVYGGPGDDALTTPPNSDPGYAGIGLVGGRGDDRLILHAPNQSSASGGPGRDKLIANVSNEADSSGYGLPTSYLGADLRGGRGADRLLGASGDDDLYGGPGRDVLRGRGGDDRFVGDGYGRPASDVIDGGAGEDQASWLERRRPIVADLRDGREWGPEGEVDRLTGIEDLEGGRAPDVLRGDDGPNSIEADTFDGGAPGDLVVGRGGDDFLVIGRGDRVRCGAGHDEVAGRKQAALPADCEEGDR